MAGVLDHPWTGPALIGAGFVAAMLAMASRSGTAPRWIRPMATALMVPVGAALGGLAFVALLWLVRPHVPGWMTRGYPVTPRSCAQARAMGYGTARVGTPGYFAHLDADNDGWSCEPMPRRRRTWHD